MQEQGKFQLGQRTRGGEWISLKHADRAGGELERRLLPEAQSHFGQG